MKIACFTISATQPFRSWSWNHHFPDDFRVLATGQLFLKLNSSIFHWFNQDPPSSDRPVQLPMRRSTSFPRPRAFLPGDAKHHAEARWLPGFVQQLVGQVAARILRDQSPFCWEVHLLTGEKRLENAWGYHGNHWEILGILGILWNMNGTRNYGNSAVGPSPDLWNHRNGSALLGVFMWNSEDHFLRWLCGIEGDASCG